MDTALPQGIEGARHPNRRPVGRPERPVRLHCDGTEIPVLEWWEKGFSVDVKAPLLTRGIVEVFVAGHLSCQGLAYTTGQEKGRRSYAFKRMQDAAQKQPRDYAEVRPEPAGLITKNP